MARNKLRTVLYRRKREKRTNYVKRRKLLLGGAPRLVVRVTNTRVVGQIVSFTPKGDIIHAAVDSQFLARHGWSSSLKNIPAAYLTGYALAKKAIAAGIINLVFDTGLRAPPHKGRLYAFLKGAIEGGLDAPVGDKAIFPSEERLSGKHITEYLKSKGQQSDITTEFTKVKVWLTKSSK